MEAAHPTAAPARSRERPHALGSLIARLRSLACGERISVSDLVEGLGHASFTPLLLVPALIVVSPLSGIPILPSVCGLTIALIAGQMVFGRRHLWLPQWLLSRSVDCERLKSALGWLERPAGWVDGITAHRLDVLVSPPIAWLLLLACALSGAVMPLLEVLPFTSSILAAAVCLMATGLLVRDGLVAVAGLGFVAMGVGLIGWLVL